MSIGKMVTR